jgi:serine/threonine-protein kinase
MTDPLAGLLEALRDRYRIDREVGRGSMATVFRAHDVRNDRWVALKLLHRGVGAAMGGERFREAVQSAARLEHPHIQTVHDAGEDGAQFWFTMPFVDGETLHARLRREGWLPVAEALRIAREAAEALDYAHRQGVIHRDIKPENILLSDGRVLVADFGIARALGGTRSGASRAGLPAGTPAYMSPEQVTGAAIDARTDIYSLGAVLYEMLLGEPPFTGATPQAVIARAITESPRPLRAIRPSVPAPVETLTLRALARAPEDRFATAAELGEALEAAQAVVRTGPLRTPPPSMVSWPGTAMRWPTPAVLVLSAGLLIFLWLLLSR